MARHIRWRTIYNSEVFARRLRAKELKVHTYEETNAFISKPKLTTSNYIKKTDLPLQNQGIGDIHWSIISNANSIREHPQPTPTSNLANFRGKR